MTNKTKPDLICADCNRIINVDGGEGAYTCERCGTDPICAECGGDDANPGRVTCEDCAVSEETLTAQAGDIYCETGLTPRELAEQREELREVLRRYVDADTGVDPDDLLRCARAALAKTEPK